ncbi:hypothetical protein [Bittarella massiliensis (ex Durand et al. 2017)]|uniref:Uncharacterized protein n=1 Tax=Bittarella massiliensis (ex Durand et al. 2017) TaxID=1720313 RepID=A0AAW5K8E2_9FIRM|nr:hypothetical protein [Bittarella massiliensis (ex Durand et al. 2017)]MCQ4948282.1 hypothetical protein [Bittarella massiliensis (ex Durand et al. 2017)]
MKKRGLSGLMAALMFLLPAGGLTASAAAPAEGEYERFQAWYEEHRVDGGTFALRGDLLLEEGEWYLDTADLVGEITIDCGPHQILMDDPVQSAYLRQSGGGLRIVGEGRPDGMIRVEDGVFSLYGVEVVAESGVAIWQGAPAWVFIGSGSGPTRLSSRGEGATALLWAGEGDEGQLDLFQAELSVQGRDSAALRSAFPVCAQFCTFAAQGEGAQSVVCQGEITLSGSSARPDPTLSGQPVVRRAWQLLGAPECRPVSVLPGASLAESGLPTAVSVDLFCEEEDNYQSPYFPVRWDENAYWNGQATGGSFSLPGVVELPGMDGLLPGGTVAVTAEVEVTGAAPVGDLCVRLPEREKDPPALLLTNPLTFGGIYLQSSRDGVSPGKRSGPSPTRQRAGKSWPSTSATWRRGRGSFGCGSPALPGRGSATPAALPGTGRSSFPTRNPCLPTESPFRPARSRRRKSTRTLTGTGAAGADRTPRPLCPAPTQRRRRPPAVPLSPARPARRSRCPHSPLNPV